VRWLHEKDLLAMRSVRAKGFKLVSSVAIAAPMLLLGSGCTQLRTHQGYIVDNTLVDSVAVGIDNRASVERTLGRPTFANQFGVAAGQAQIVTPDQASDWYYLSRNTRQLAFANPSVAEQLVLHVRFDAAGNVTAIDRTGAETIADISPESDKTPTLGRERSFFEELFGNIGSVGAAGGSAGGAGPGG
jgi:outer membrane protein assembly factor BamE (lipoprotein component of BamABCDE complex)